MKTKINFLLLVLILSCVSVFSQEHLKFKDIPITGTLTEFSNKLVQIGYVVTERNINSVVLKGSFVGKSNSEVRVIGTKQNKIAWKVVVYLPEQTSWNQIKSSYLDLKEQYKSKYGEAESLESFSTPYYEGDGYEMQAVKAEKCDYFTLWNLELGGIVLKISQFEQIAISYEDKIGTTIRDKEEKAIVEKDI